MGQAYRATPPVATPARFTTLGFQDNRLKSIRSCRATLAVRRHDGRGDNGFDLRPCSDRPYPL